VTVLEILQARRTVHDEIQAISRQIESCQHTGKPTGYPTGISPEKVKDTGGEGSESEYVRLAIATNHPEAMRGQHEAGYRAALDRLMEGKRDILMAAEELIELERDGVSRAILRYYYCNGLTDAEAGAVIGMGKETVCRKRKKSVRFFEKDAKKYANIEEKLKEILKKVNRSQ